MTIDLKVDCGTLLTVNLTNDVLKNTSLIIHNGRIIDIIHTAESHKYTPKNTINAQNHIVMPGLVNTHTHIGMAYFKGLADDLALESWLQDYIWPAEAKHINPQFVKEASLHGIGEMIKNGITFFCDMYFLPTETVNSCKQAGIRATICDIGMDVPIEGVHEPQRNFSHIEEYQESVADHPLVNYCLGVHSVYTCSQNTLELAIKTAQKHDMLLVSHLCETQKESTDCLKLTGKNPVQYLYDLGIFDQRFLFAHGVHLCKDDIQLIADKPCSLSLNIHSNLKLASGIPPLADYLKNKINISFGTDSVASNNTLSILAEISTAAKLYKAIYSDPTFLPAVELVRMATINGAKALCADHETGSLEIGKSADFICINTESFQAQPIYDPYSHIVYACNSSDIDHVIIAGKIIMQNRQLLTIKEDDLLANARKYAQTVGQPYMVAVPDNPPLSVGTPFMVSVSDDPPLSVGTPFMVSVPDNPPLSVGQPYMVAVPDNPPLSVGTPFMVSVPGDSPMTVGNPEPVKKA